MKLVFLILINILFTFNSVAQCIISSTCGYNVNVSITPASIVPSNLSCPFGYNYNVTFNYSITVTGVNTCYNGNIGIQPQIFCNGGQNNGFFTINITAPIVGNSSSSTTYNGTLTTTSNQYRNLSDCNTVTTSSLGCNSIDITTYGPGIPNQIINCNPLALPVDLLNFSATNIDNQYVKLNWQTASEINNDYFTIEKSQNGIDWKDLITVDGAGNSSTLLDYEGSDISPYMGVSYYRLRQTDFDGEFSYSNIKSINFNLVNNQIEIFPNPTKKQIIITGNKSEIETINIYNVLGQNVTNKTIIKKLDNKVIIDLTELSEGTYYIRTKTTANKVYKQ